MSTNDYDSPRDIHQRVDHRQIAHALRPDHLELHRAQVADRDQRRLVTLVSLKRLDLEYVIERHQRDAGLGYPDMRAAAIRYQQLEERISEDVARGATRHRRLAWLTRQIPRLVALIDGAVLFTFCAVIFNVDMSHPQIQPARTLAALMLAVLATGVAYTWLGLTGGRLKTFRGELGEVSWRLVGRTTWVMVAISIALIGALSLLMFDRVATALRDTGDLGLMAVATMLGTVFAVISAIANLCVIAVHALDGSVAADEHRNLGRALLRYQNAVHHHHRAALKAAGRLDDWRRAGHPEDVREVVETRREEGRGDPPGDPEDPLRRSA